MIRYTVKAERSGKWWALQCVEVPGAISQVARLDEAAETIREAIAWVAGVPEEEVEIEVVPVLPEAVGRRLEASESLRKESARLNSEAAEQTRAAVGELHESLKLTYREIGSLLGISHQRAAQLATEAKASNATDLPIPGAVDLISLAEFPEMELPELLSTLRGDGTVIHDFLDTLTHSLESENIVSAEIVEGSVSGGIKVAFFKEHSSKIMHMPMPSKSVVSHAGDLLIGTVGVGHTWVPRMEKAFAPNAHIVNSRKI